MCFAYILPSTTLPTKPSTKTNHLKASVKRATGPAEVHPGIPSHPSRRILTPVSRTKKPHVHAYSHQILLLWGPLTKTSIPPSSPDGPQKPSERCRRPIIVTELTIAEQGRINDILRCYTIGAMRAGPGRAWYISRPSRAGRRS
jgi:hypothetical protein